MPEGDLVTQEKQPAPWLGALAALLRNIAAGFRLAVFRRVAPEDFRVNANQAVLALLALVAADCLYTYLLALPNPVFNSYGVGPLAAGLVGMMLGLWALALVRRIPDALPMLFVSVATASITSSAFIYAGIAGVQHSFPLLPSMLAFAGLLVFPGLFLGAAIWTGLIANRAQRLVLGNRSWKNGLASLLYVAFLFAPAIALPQQSLWYSGYEADDADSDAAEYQPVDVERTFYAQVPLVESELAHLEAGRPGVTDLYFVGFAGYGSQDVFMKEVRFAETLFADRFDTDGRQIALINNRATLDDLPLASGSNLRLALKGIGERMDRDEDVLFLFLTSHGSPGLLATDFWPMQLNDLTPGELRAALDEAGIRWRVIVVSACYSGSFIDDLQNEETLIITAARKDRTSFGCSDEADFTYFGRAFLDQALHETRSFIDAFGRASQAIAVREEEEGITPSQPQIRIGGQVRGKLLELEKRLNDLQDVAARG